MAKLYITDDYLYYKKKYQKGRYTGVHNWKYLRNEIASHAGNDEEYINERTHESYGFIYCNKSEYNRIMGLNEAVYSDTDWDEIFNQKEKKVDKKRNAVEVVNHAFDRAMGISAGIVVVFLMFGLIVAIFF